MRTLILAAAIASAYALLRGWPASVPALLRITAGVVIVAFALVLWSRCKSPGTPAHATSRRRSARLDILAATLAVLSVEAVFVAFLTIVPPHAESLATSLGESFRPMPGKPVDSPQQKSSRSGNWLWHRPGARQLPLHADFHPGNRPEVFVRVRDRADAALLLRSRIYVAAFTLERYAQAEWSAPNTGNPTLLEADPAGFIRFPDRPGRPIAHEVFHSVDPSGATPLIALQGVVSAEIPTLRDLGGGLRILPPPPPKAIGHQYLVVSKPLLIGDLPADAAVPDTDIPAHLLEIPESGGLGPRLRELAALATGSGTPVQRLRNLRNHLRTTLKYSLEIKNPDNLDPLENFLFHEQHGSCELFATAGTLLARSIGVPARIAYGWTGGRYFETQNLIVFRTREAHAWTEVLINDYGWVVFDPTPPGALDSANATIAAQDEAVPGTDPDSSLAEADKADQSPASDSPSPRAILALLAALALPTLGIALLRASGTRRRHAAEAAASAPQSFPSPDYLAAFRHAAVRAGHPLPPGRPLRRHLAAMAREAPPAAAALVDYHYATRYEFAARDPANERKITRALEKWRPK